MFELEKPLNEVRTINHIPGWMDGRMMGRLIELGEGLETIVNIGAWKGRSCAALARKCQGIVWAIDTWRGSPGELKTNHKQAADAPLSVYWEFCQYMNHFGLLGTKVIPLTGNSVSVANLFKPYSVDLAFVDGGHDVKSVERDLAAWMGRVRKGGTLCGDDYSWAGVRQAVDEFHNTYHGIYGLGELEIEIDGKLWLIRREL